MIVFLAFGVRTIRLDYAGRLDARTVLGDGSVRFNARLTRTGVFDYGDHRELRVPEEVFAKQALDSFKGVAVTEGHRAFVDPDNWREYAIGHVGDDVRRDGDFVVGSLIVKDKAALAKIQSGELAEISMGYEVDLEPTAGRTDAGEEYDSIQRNIRGNHAALGPHDWGRMGPNVRLLDAAYAPPMLKNGQRIDAPEARTDAGTTSNEDALRKDLDAVRAERDAASKRADKAEAERDAAKADAAAAAKRADTAEAERDQARKDLDAAKKDTAAEKIDARVKERLALLDAARVILGADFAFAGKTDRDVRIAALTKADSSFSADGKSDGYVEARFDLAVESAKKETSSLAALGAVSGNPAPKTDATVDDATVSPVEKARAEMQKRHEDAWKPKAAKPSTK